MTSSANKIYNQARKLSANLRAKGITSANANMGFSALVDLVEDIEQDGIPLVTTLTCTTDKSSLGVNEVINISGVLSVGYNDTGSDNVDISDGRITNASIKIYNGDTLLGNVVTDSNGEYSFNYSPNTTGNYSIHSDFEGNGFHTGATSSNQSVSVKESVTLSLSSNKNSAYVNEGITFTGTLSIGSGESIQLYDKGNLIETITTTTDGAFSTTVHNMGSGSHSYQVKYDGDATYNKAESSIVNVTVNTLGTNVSITVPTVLKYSDSFNITGVLKDGLNNAMSGETVYLYVSGEESASTVTGSDGVYSFTSTPVHRGTHTFQIIYKGDNYYNSSSSSIITKTSSDINKETTVLTTNLSNNQYYYNDSSITISGTLLTDDAEPITDATIVIINKEGLLDTITTNNNGEYSSNISFNTTGEDTLTIIYGGDANYNHSIINRTINLQNPTITLTSNKNILSYADEDTCTLTATYTGATVTGKTVQVYNSADDSLVGTMTDNNDGTYSYTYSSNGSGDLSLYVKTGKLVSETCSIYDYVFYDSATDNSKSARYGSIVPLESTQTGGTFSYDSTNTCWKIVCNDVNTKGLPILPLASKTDFKVTVDLYLGNSRSNSISGGLFVGQKGQGLDYVMAGGGSYDYYRHVYGSSGTGVLQGSGGVFNDWFTLELTYTNNTVSVRYLQGTTVLQTHSTSLSYTPTQFGIAFGYASNQSIYFKNVKVEPLDSLSLTSSASVLSYTDSDSATLTATHSKGSGKTVQLYDSSDDSLIGTMTDNGDGTYSYIYASQANGDVCFYAKSGSLTSETITIEDIFYYWDCLSNDGHWTLGNGFTFSNSGITMHQATANGICDIQLPLNCEVSVEATYFGDTRFAPNVGGLGTYSGYYASYNYLIVMRDWSSSDPWGTRTEDTSHYYGDGLITIKLLNTIGSVIVNNQTLTSKTISTNTRVLELPTNSATDNSRKYTFKNLKVKPLFLLSSDKSILSYVDSDTCTLTATHPLGTGKSVNLYDSSDGSLIGAMTDEGDGTYTYEYTSQGIGDIGFYAKSSNLESETITIEDCYKYVAQEYSVTTNTSSEKYTNFSNDLNFNLVDYEMSCECNPSTYNIGIVVKKTSTDNMVSSPSIADNGGKIRAYLRNSGGSEITVDFPTAHRFSFNNWNNIKIRKQNSTVTFTNEYDSVSSTNITYLDEDVERTVGVLSWTSATIKVRNVKIKPL